MIRAAILGATGYSALELMKILIHHPQVEITALTTRQEGNPHVGTIHPSLVSRLDMVCRPMEPAEVAEAADCVFGCLPHGVTSKVVPQLLDLGKKVIDLSADYRLDDAQTYSHWYGETHNDPDRLGDAPYGLPELFAERIAEANLVANPGCYPTSAILALAPLLQGGLIEPDTIIVDSKSGVSGAGRSPTLTTHYPECNESISAYNVGRHRHTPEIEQVLQRATGQSVSVIFTPHLVPMDRGILTTTYSVPTGDATEDELLGATREFYADKPFVRVVEHLPATKDTHGTNFCDVTVRLVRNRVL
ncbi:MAG: N-acetyl-gamma-glutamyl-phosphate reductase, partial [Planctomycetales bacterium]